MTTADTTLFSWSAINPADWLRAWQTVWRSAPNNLTQPILPGWTLNINSNNSSSPQTEADIVAKHSYGRQIGRMADALELLIVEQHGKAPKEKRLADFLSIKRDIDNVKREAAAARVERIAQDLALLKAQDEAQYVRLRDALRDVLK